MPARPLKTPDGRATPGTSGYLPLVHAAPTEEVLVLAHGFDSDMLAELVRAKLAKRYVLTVRAGGRPATPDR